jgi:hypothetical protein
MIKEYLSEENGCEMVLQYHRIYNSHGTMEEIA